MIREEQQGWIGRVYRYQREAPLRIVRDRYRKGVEGTDCENCRGDYKQPEAELLETNVRLLPTGLELVGTLEGATGHG